MNFEFDLHQMVSLKINAEFSGVSFSFSSKTTLKMSNVHTGNTLTTQASTTLPEEFYGWVRSIAFNYRLGQFLPLTRSNQPEQDHHDVLTQIVSDVQFPSAYEGFDRFQTFIPDSLYREIENLYHKNRPVALVVDSVGNQTGRSDILSK